MVAELIISSSFGCMGITCNHLKESVDLHNDIKWGIYSLNVL